MEARRGASAAGQAVEARNLPGDLREFDEAPVAGLSRAGRPLSWLRLVKHGTADQTQRHGDTASVGVAVFASAPSPASSSVIPHRAASLAAGPSGSRGLREPASRSAIGGRSSEAAASGACSVEFEIGSPRAGGANGGGIERMEACGGADATPESAPSQSSVERSRIVGDLYRANYHRVFGFARRLVGEDEAEEVAHEAFCRLLKVRNLERMTISTAYLLRIAENLIRRKYERAQRYRVVLERSGMVVSDRSEDSRTACLPGGDGSGEPAESPLDSARLASVLRRLTSEEQSAVRLIVCEGLDYQAAARSLGVPVSTINNWKYRGLAKLRQLIDAPSALRPCAARSDRLSTAI
jgi:RNA polymerase sigma-70 factor (ECF subfamily)